jgi:Na+:H+ antiporter, NhaC family
MTQKKPTLFIAAIPLVTMALFLAVGYGIFHIRAEVLLVGSAFVAGLIGYFVLGTDWKSLESGIVKMMTQALPAMFIVITVGLLIGSWMVAGTIPMLIYYGLKLISPHYFLITASIVCSFVSLFTGTSWGTVGTIGIALMGVARGFGLPEDIAAAAIISGAYFGDKLSPFSDTTNLAPLVAKANLFDHIRHMLWTTLPAWIIGLAVYFFVGLRFSGDMSRSQDILLISEGILQNYQLSLWLLLPPVLVLYGAIRKMPTLPVMLVASLTAVALAVIFQKSSLPDALSALAVGVTTDTGLPELDKLLSRGGMMSMMGVTLIAFAAFAFAGIIQGTGMLDVILKSMERWIKSRASLVATTVFSSITTAFITGSSFLAIILPGELFADAFKKLNLAAKNLSRTTEDSGTVIVPLVPWSMAGIFMSGTLGVAVLDYVPWAISLWLGVAFALFYGMTGIGIAPKINDDETVTGS